ncbi:transglycosylase domain-containing protein [Arthrobacter sp. ISL-5]|uniref:transglycosylase domain-containing protein n=1 Tax=Arthrobacter sp. ISL-5 TaxID=2819111 RepID=UPI001BE72575|nr:transglycosylase domain-containing protein [Arthrobacter sp. ISL-5]MBT2553162.1 penicillin-binding protein [Arthrobacter sp. ISL-5]
MAGKSFVFRTARALAAMLGFVIVSGICGVLVASFLVPGAALAGTTVSNSISYFKSLPTELAVPTPAQTTRMVTADGKLIATFYAENRVQVPLKQMSPFIRDAVVAIEDSRFYEHSGVDTQGVLRALTSNLTRGERQGASTLTQQYVTNVANEALISAGREEQVVLSGQKSMGDKLREMRLAMALEKKFTKDQILEGYLNIVFFHRTAYGIEAAAQYFYSVPASKLTLPQAALLAGLVNSPSFYDPVANPKNSIARRNQVLAAMLSQGKITKKQHAAAVATGVGLKVRPSKQGCAAAAIAPYFCDYVTHLVLNNPAYGADTAAREQKLYRGGLTITTTLDSRLQEKAQAQVNATAGPNPAKWGASLVTVQPGTGKILAMAQNTVFLPQRGKFDTQLNFNVDSKDPSGNDLNGAGGFQPGSTMKPFTFAAWLQQGRAMTEVVDASRREYPLGFRWRSSCGKVLGAYSTKQQKAGREAAEDLQNASEGYYRKMPADYGLYNSINTATFAEAAQLDFCGIQNMVDAVGLHSGLDGAPVNMHQLGNLLGGTGVSPMSLANAFATFAADGRYCAPFALLRVADAAGRQLPGQAAECRSAVRRDVARGVNKALQDMLTKGSGIYINPKVQSRVPVAAKTGTNNTNGASWVVGYTTGLATASFFGDALEGQQRPGRNLTINGKFYSRVDGYMIAGPQWANYMVQVARLYPAAAFPKPPAAIVAKPKPKPAPIPRTSASPRASASPSASAKD